MVTLDRIRLTGLLQKKPRRRGFFYAWVVRAEIEELVEAESAGALTLKGFVKPVSEFRTVDVTADLEQTPGTSDSAQNLGKPSDSMG
jgi:hypothetical protein